MMSFTQFFISKDFWKVSTSRLKKERKCHHVVLVWSFALSIWAWERGGTDWRKKVLLANVKKLWEITHMELIEPTLGKWCWHVGTCRTWPFSLTKVQIKLNCPRENSGDNLHVGPWKLLWPVKKKKFFLWDNNMCIKTASSSCRFHLLQCILNFPVLTAAGRKVPHYEVVNRVTRSLFPSAFPEWKNKSLYWDAIPCTVHCWTGDMERATPENRKNIMQQLYVQHQWQYQTQKPYRFEAPDTLMVTWGFTHCWTLV